MLLTFDDGYRDNFDLAVPILANEASRDFLYSLFFS